MSRYELYLFVHIVAAAIWVGGGFMLIVLGIQAERSREENRLLNVFQQVGDVAEKVIVPSSIVVLLMGLLMIFDGPWGFGSLWIVLGLVGYAATFVAGIGVLTPMANRIGEALGKDGLTPENLTGIRRLLTIARADTVVLMVVLADMAIKPTGDDVGVLAVMALAVAGGIAYIVMRLKAIDAEGAPGLAARPA